VSRTASRTRHCLKRALAAWTVISEQDGASALSAESELENVGWCSLEAV